MTEKLVITRLGSHGEGIAEAAAGPVYVPYALPGETVEIDRGPILAPALSGAIAAAWDIAEVLAPARKPLDIQVAASDAGLDVDVRGSGRLTAADTAALARVARDEIWRGSRATANLSH